MDGAKLGTPCGSFNAEPLEGAATAVADSATWSATGASVALGAAMAICVAAEAVFWAVATATDGFVAAGADTTGSAPPFMDLRVASSERALALPAFEVCAEAKPDAMADAKARAPAALVSCGGTLFGVGRSTTGVCCVGFCCAAPASVIPRPVAKGTNTHVTAALPHRGSPARRDPSTTLEPETLFNAARIGAQSWRLASICAPQPSSGERRRRTVAFGKAVKRKAATVGVVAWKGESTEPARPTLVRAAPHKRASSGSGKLALKFTLAMELAHRNGPRAAVAAGCAVCAAGRAAIAGAFEMSAGQGAEGDDNEAFWTPGAAAGLSCARAAWFSWASDCAGTEPCDCA